MKKISLLIVLVLFCTPAIYAQYLSFQATVEDSINTKTLFEKLTSLEKKTDKLKIYLNMHGSYNAYFSGSDFDQMSFKMNQLRIEAKGHVNDWIFYRWRQRLNRSNDPRSLDNLPNSIDYAAVGFNITPKFAIFAGKQSTCYGGFEFDLNPIEVYEYCDMLEYMTNFLTGVDFSYWVTQNHEFRFQIVDTRNGSFDEMFGKVAADIEKSKTPLGYTLNWNGGFFENILKTRWSASVFHDAKGKNMYYYALGTELNLKKFHMFFDFMYSDEALDRKGIISDIAYNAGFEDRALNAKYMSLVAHFNYWVHPKWNVFVKGMYETASVYKANAELEKGKYKTSWGYLGGLEFYPMKQNLHFFLTYVGRSYNFEQRAKNFGVANYDTQRLSLGFIYQLPVF